jgi:hypothetical protein
MTLIVVMIDAALDDVGHGLDPSVWVLGGKHAETNPPSAPQTVRGCDPAHRRRHQWLDAMLRRHSLLNRRSFDPEEGSFNSSHGNSLLRSGAYHIR